MASCHSNERGGAGNAAVACDLLPQTYSSTFVSDSDLSAAVHSAGRTLRILTDECGHFQSATCASMFCGLAGDGGRAIKWATGVHHEMLPDHVMSSAV